MEYYAKVFEDYSNHYIAKIKVEKEEGLNEEEWKLKKETAIKNKAAIVAAHLASQAKVIGEEARRAKYENFDKLIDEFKEIIMNSVTKFGEYNR